MHESENGQCPFAEKPQLLLPVLQKHLPASALSSILPLHSFDKGICHLPPPCPVDSTLHQQLPRNL